MLKRLVGPPTCSGWAWHPPKNHGNNFTQARSTSSTRSSSPPLSRSASSFLRSTGSSAHTLRWVLHIATWTWPVGLPEPKAIALELTFDDVWLSVWMKGQQSTDLTGLFFKAVCPRGLSPRHVDATGLRTCQLSLHSPVGRMVTAKNLDGRKGGRLALRCVSRSCASRGNVSPPLASRLFLSSALPHGLCQSYLRLLHSRISHFCLPPTSFSYINIRSYYFSILQCCSIMAFSRYVWLLGDVCAFVCSWRLL